MSLLSSKVEQISWIEETRKGYKKYPTDQCSVAEAYESDLS